MRGRYGAFRILSVSVNLMLAVLAVAVFVSGAMLSEYVFGFGGASMEVRQIHSICANWLFVLAGAPRQNRGGQDKPVTSRRSRSRGGIRTGKRRLPACAPRARSSAAQRLQRTLTTIQSGFRVSEPPSLNFKKCQVQESVFLPIPKRYRALIAAGQLPVAARAQSGNAWRRLCARSAFSQPAETTPKFLVRCGSF